MRKLSERGLGAAAAGLALLVAACGPRPDGPAPVISGEPATSAEPLQVKVRPGQTLSGISHTYHVPMSLIAEANHLAPPYRIEAGRTLVVPQPDQSSLAAASAMPPQSVQTAATRPPAALPLERTALPPAVTPSAAPAMPPAPTASAPSAVAEAQRPEAKTAAPPTPAAPPAPAAAPEPAAASSVPTPPAGEAGTFSWPLHGRILAGYGSGRDGTHNDGINIAAPRGAAVEATDGGVVAYAGNELRGYGNLILVKHPNGWISAYAHCDVMLVKRGEKVARGQVIARVGSTGSVAEPQLHFELRRGNHAVDPRAYLAPLPTAGAERSSPPS
jgi:murein DD-endopeptidase MepM/ murein hydrolase activator NlpD